MERGQGSVQILCNKRPRRDIKLSFVFCFISLVNLFLWFWLSLWSLYTFFFFYSLLPFLQSVFLFLWQRGCGVDEEFWNMRWEGRMGACALTQCGFTTEWMSDKDAQHSPKKTVFLVWMPVELRHYDLHLKRQLLSVCLSLALFLSLCVFLSLSLSLSRSPRVSGLLSDGRLVLNTVFPVTVHSTKSSVLTQRFCSSVSDQPNYKHVFI